MREKIFAENISALIEANRDQTGQNIRQFAERLDVPYGWLRRISTQGIKQENKRTLPYLERLAHEFGLYDYRDLWERLADELDSQEILDALREKHPAQWHLYMANLYQHHEDVADVAAGIEIKKWAMAQRDTKMSVSQAADFWARWIYASFEVVEKPKPDPKAASEKRRRILERRDKARGQQTKVDTEKEEEDWQTVLETWDVEDKREDEISLEDVDALQDDGDDWEEES